MSRREKAEKIVDLLWDVEGLQRRFKSQLEQAKGYADTFPTISVKCERRAKQIKSLIAVKELRIDKLKKGI